MHVKVEWSSVSSKLCGTLNMGVAVHLQKPGFVAENVFDFGRSKVNVNLCGQIPQQPW